MEMPIRIVGAEEVSFGLWSKEPIVVTEADRCAMEDTEKFWDQQAIERAADLNLSWKLIQWRGGD